MNKETQLEIAKAMTNTSPPDQSENIGQMGN